jgi:hypothetical protein
MSAKPRIGLDLRLPSSAQRAEGIAFCTTTVLDGAICMHEALIPLTNWKISKRVKNPRSPPWYLAKAQKFSNGKPTAGHLSNLDGMYIHTDCSMEFFCFAERRGTKGGSKSDLKKKEKCLLLEVHSLRN